MPCCPDDAAVAEPFSEFSTSRQDHAVFASASAALIFQISRCHFDEADAAFAMLLPFMPLLLPCCRELATMKPRLLIR